MSQPYVAIQIPMMPKDTNRHGTIFGGVLLFLESLTKSGVQHGHSFVKGFTGSGSALLVHTVVFVLLFVLYAHMLRVSVF